MTELSAGGEQRVALEGGGSVALIAPPGGMLSSGELSVDIGKSGG